MEKNLPINFKDSRRTILKSLDKPIRITAKVILYIEKKKGPKRLA